MSERADADFLRDIQEAVRRVQGYTAAMTYEAFLADSKTQDAVVRNLEVLGEATKSLSAEFRAKYAQVPWKGMAGVRDKLIHHYFGVNLDIVWRIASDELPGVASQIQEVLEKELSGG